MMKCMLLHLLLLTFTILTSAKPPLNPYEAVMKRKSIELGLYDASDKVVILTSANFNDEVLHRNRSSLVEFYNSYCGHCKRFAPVYKHLAEQLQNWRDFIMIGAIDCAAEENSDICREYEIMAYPSLRYMRSNFTPTDKNYGHDVESQVPLDIYKKLANWLLEEHSNLQALNYEEAEQLLLKADKVDVYNFVIFEPENSTVGIQTKLHFITWPQVNIWYTSEQRIGTLFDLNAEKCIANIEEGIRMNCTSMKNNKIATFYINMIEENLSTLDVTESPITISTAQLNSTPVAAAADVDNSEIISYVKSKKHLVYQADLEMAVHTILTTEVPRAADISGEKLLALKRILAVIKRYQPLSKYGSGNTLVSRMYNFTTGFANNQLNGREFGLENHRLQDVLPKPIFVSENYVGCLGSHGNSRGFTCSLWQLFHYLTVQAASHHYTNEGPLDVLQAIHGYVKHFFGCTECSKHFQEMAVRRRIWDVASKDNAVIWLWSAHNEVNNRLKGDTTEDAEFPKIQFPSEESCATCHHASLPALNIQTANEALINTTGENWNKSAVLDFLKNIHNPENLSQYGIKYLNISSSIEQMRHKRMITNAFSDLDMRVAMLLYAFCVVMIVLAFKLFVFKGSHRRKNYTPNELLGKV